MKLFNYSLLRISLFIILFFGFAISLFEKNNVSSDLFQIDLSDKPDGFFLIQIKQGDIIKQAGIVKE